MSGPRESVINYLMFVYYFIAVFNFLLPVKAALHYGGLYTTSLTVIIFGQKVPII